MRSLRPLISLILLLCLPAAAVVPAKKSPPRKKKVQAQIAEIIAQPEMASAFWGIVVVDEKTGKTVFSINPDHLFLPASNNKLVTTAAALALIGPDYRFHTTIETTGKLDGDGKLKGDLTIVGRGDPNISGRVLPYQLKSERIPPHTQILEELADQLVRKGLKEVDGDLIGDDTYYSAEKYGDGWAQDDLQWIDGAPVSALSFNDNVVFLRIQPAVQIGDKAIVTFDPPTDYYQLDNRVITSPPGVPRKVGIHRDTGSNQVVAWGSIPLSDLGMNEALAVEDPAELTARIFLGLLEQRGIKVTGKAAVHHADRAQFFDQPVAAASAAGAGAAQPVAVTQDPGPAPAPATGQIAPEVLAEHVSLPLLDDIRVTNKTSQNLHAELDLRLLGKLKGAGGSFEAGSAVAKQFLLGAGVKENDFFLVDGSGLSRRDLITPQAIARLLLYAAQQQWGSAFQESLPVAGVDGSLSERFVNTPAGGLVHAKTGTLSHVNALSGYGQTRKGRKFVFSIFCNNHDVIPASRVLAAIDAIVKALVTDGDGVMGRK